MHQPPFPLQKIAALPLKEEAASAHVSSVILVHQVLCRASQTHGAATLKHKEYLRNFRLSQLAINRITVTKSIALSAGANNGKR